MSKLIKKIGMAGLFALLSAGMMAQLVSCSSGAIGEKGDKGDAGDTGSAGRDGVDGKDGASLLVGHGEPTRELGENDDSYIDLDTFDYYVKGTSGWVRSGNIKGEDGNAGKSAYEIWLDAGNSGTESDFLDWLRNSSQSGAEGNPQALDFYPLDDGTYAVSVGKAKYLSKIEIPEKYNGKNVTTVIDGGFADSAVTDLTIPSTVTTLGKTSFGGCKISKLSIDADIISESFANTYFDSSYLTELTLGDHVATVGKNAFANCGKLTTLAFSAFTTLGDKSFGECDALKTIYYDGAIKDWASSKLGVSETDRPNFNSNFENLYLSDPNGSATYKEKQYKKIEGELKIDDGTTDILAGAFYNVKHITSLVLSDSVASIGRDAFYGSTDLEKVTIGSGMIVLGQGAFQQCDKLTDVNLGTSLQMIEMDAFAYCYNLTTIKIPSSVTNIKDGAFADCYSLVEVINLSSLKITPGSDENGGVAEYAITVKMSGESGIEREGDYLFLKSSLGAKHLVKYLGEDSVITLPSGTSETQYAINKYAFYDNDAITKVTIPEGAASIGASAFEQCSNLENVIIGDSVTEIGESAFIRCVHLFSVTIGDNVKTIGDYAFYGTSLVEVINLSNLLIAEGDTEYGYVGYYALTIKDSGTSEIVSSNGFVFLTADTVNYLVKYIGNDAQVTLPSDFNGETYQIHEKAFYDNTTITSIVFSKNITEVGNYAFCNCPNLKSVYYLGESLDEWSAISIGSSKNDSLTSATIYCYSETKPASSSSIRCWHYVDGTPTEW